MAVQSDFQKYQAAFREWKASGNPKPPSIVRDYLRAQLQARNAESGAKGYGPAQFGNLNQKVNKELKKVMPKAVTKEQLMEAAKQHKTLRSASDSTCIATLDWKDGVATYTFVKGGGDEPYETEMSLEEFIAWSESESLGQTFNELYRE